MAVANNTIALRLAPRGTFTLSDILFFIFGLSVGLAYWRWSANPWPTALFAAFITWLVVGLVQRLSHVLAAATNPSLAGQRNYGQWVRAGLSTTSLILLATVAPIELTFRHHAAAGTLRENASIFYLHEVADVLFYLAIMAAFWMPTQASLTTSKLRGALRLVVDLTLIGIAAYWATKAFTNIVVILQLVHIAISGVINSLPNRWGGHALTPISFQAAPLEALWLSLFGVFSALAFAAALAALLTFRFTRRAVPRGLACIAFALASATAGDLLAHVWRQGLHKLSPFFAEAFQQMARDAWPAAAMLIMTLSAAIALGVSVTAAPIQRNADTATSPFVFRLPVLLLFMAAVLSEVAREIWNFAVSYAPTFAPVNPLVSPWLACTYATHILGEFLVNWPIKMIAPAALLVVARYGWWTWKGRDVFGENWVVQPGQLVLLWLFTAVVLALLLPFAICWMLMMAIGSIPNA